LQTEVKQKLLVEFIPQALRCESRFYTSVIVNGLLLQVEAFGEYCLRIGAMNTIISTQIIISNIIISFPIGGLVVE
jgi:hypothetical protein